MEISYSRGALVLAALTILSSGCAVRHSPDAVVSQSPSRSADIPTVQRSAAFVRIKTAFQKRAYGDAIQQIDALKHNTDLSDADRIYLDRQTQICQNAISGKIKSVSTSSATGLVSTQQTPNLPADCGPRALFFICRQTDTPASLTALTQVAHTQPGRGTNMTAMVQAAKSVGFTARGVQVDNDALHNIKPPALAWVDGDHYIAVTEVKGETATTYDPNQTGTQSMPLTTLLQRSGGILLLLSRKS